MINIDFRADPDWLGTRRNSDLRSVTSVQLMTSFLPGDLIFEIEGVSFSLIGYRVGLVEFAMGLLMAIKRAASSGYGKARPMDLEEGFEFRKDGEYALVEADGVDTTARCSLKDLEDAIREHCIALLRFLFEEHPELRESKTLYRFYKADDLGVGDLFADSARLEEN